MMKGEIRNISGIQHSHALIWASADISLCSQAAKVETSVRTHPEPCVSRRGRFLSSREAFLGGAMGETAKESSSSAVSPAQLQESLVQAQAQGSLRPCCSLQGTGKALLPQGCPSARLRHTGHVSGGWETLLNEEFHQLLFLLLHKKFVSRFSQNTLLGFSYRSFSV